MAPIASQKVSAARVASNNSGFSYHLWIVFNVTGINHESIIKRCSSRSRSFQFKTIRFQKVKTESQRPNQSLHFDDKKLNFELLVKQTFIAFISLFLFEKMH